MDACGIYKIKSFKVVKYDKTNYGNKVVLTISNKFFGRYINFFFDLPYSFKDERLRTPNIISLNTPNKEYLFWRGLSDTDGSYRNNTNTFTIGMKQKILLDEFKSFLDKEHVKTTVKDANLNISVENLNKFAEVVGASHPRKQITLSNQLKSGPTHKTFQGVNNRMLLDKTYFNLKKMPNIRICIGEQFEAIFNNLTVTEIMKKTGVSRQTVHNWKNNATAMPLKLIDKFHNNSLKFLNEHKFLFTIGKTGSAKAYLPIRITDEILNYASCVRPTKRGLCLNIRKNKKSLDSKEEMSNYSKLNSNIQKQKNGEQILLLSMHFSKHFLFMINLGNL